ncbi:MAG: hypothetical protein GHHEDOFH_01629 [Pseudorhodoplanes sp.]|nr:hypothetical protein [Pseudorhodoplanes sp.]
MLLRVLRKPAVLAFASVLYGASLCSASFPAFAQSGDQSGEKARNQAGDPQKDNASRRAAELADVAARLPGPAGQPECVWLGRRVVNLLWRDDLDTAFRHLDLYDRFGCPGGHIQATFRCVVRQGPLDPKAPESLAARVHACWIDPAIETTPAAATNSGAPTGTTTQ